MIFKILGSVIFSFAGAIVISAAVLSGNFGAVLALGMVTAIAVYALWIN